MKWLPILNLSGSVLFLFGCTHLATKPDSIPYYSLYVQIEAPEAQAFLESGLAALQRDHGPLEFPVNKVLVRHSKRNEVGRGYNIAEGFSLTEIVDAEAGVFVIYISVTPMHAEFYPLLAHEIYHLKQPSLENDWEMEGLCMLFSETFCREQGKDWSLWEQRFHADSTDPYARAYQAALQLR